MERYNRAIRKFEREVIRNRIKELGLTDGFDVGCGNNIIAGIGIDNDVDCKADSFMDMDEKFTDDDVSEFIISSRSNF